jgi:acyl-CoA synthetase (NDP forming)
LGNGTFSRDYASLFEPRNVAVVGASNIPGKWGYIIPINILVGGFGGRVFMVNRKERSILGFPAYPSLKGIEEQVDLIFVTVPAAGVLDVIEEAAAMGVKSAVVISSNFSEVGGEGVEMERRLADIANRARMTIVGPNTMGIYSASASLCGVGSPLIPLAGGVGFVSQSGNLGVQLLGWGKSRGVGFSRFVGSGNAANTDMDDYLTYLEKDPLTRVIALYVEGLKDGRRFLEVARRITPHKPIVVLKGGRGELGGRAARSHSGAMAGKLELFESMFEQAGIVEAQHSEEFIDIVAAFDALPTAAGKRVAIMTMGGGWGVVAVDACEREGLELASLPQSAIDEIDKVLPSFWSRGNPVDLVGNLRRSSHFKTMDVLAACEEVDILIVMGVLLGKGLLSDMMLHGAVKPFFTMLRRYTLRLPSFMFSQWKAMLLPRFKKKKDTGRKSSGSPGINFAEGWLWTDTALTGRLQKLVKKTGKPVIAVAMDEREMATAARLQGRGIFSAPTPERAVRAAAKIAEYGMTLKKNGTLNRSSREQRRRGSSTC